jgi:uncharacterized protein (DUF1330 family)
MTPKIKLGSALTIGFAFCFSGLGALHAQNKTSPAFWVTETLEVSDQTALLKVIATLPPTIEAFGGHYIALGGKIAPGEGSPPRRITIVAFDSLEKAQQWFESPLPLRLAPKLKSSPRYAAISLKVSLNKLTDGRATECPLWVISGHLGLSMRCPLYPWSSLRCGAVLAYFLSKRRGVELGEEIQDGEARRPRA